MRYRRHVSRYVGALEAARRLGVQRATLYAYVSRGLIRRRVAVDGRTSLYAVDDLERLLARVRRRAGDAVPRPSIDVQIASNITVLEDDGLRYRGHDVTLLARTASFERVAELLWTGVLPDEAAWPPPDPVDVALAARVTRAVRGPALPTLVAVSSALGAHRPTDDPAAAARRLLGIAPTVLGETSTTAKRSLAWRLTARWRPDGGPALASVVDQALVLLADHELATSTLAVRVAGSTWAPPYQAFAAGLAVIQGPLHAAAAHLAYELLVDTERHGAAAVVARRLDAGERIPGFGHKIYKGDDPRLAPLLEAIATLPDPHGRAAVLDDLLREAGARLVQRPNVDLGLGALAYIAELPPGAPLFAVARIAGFAAHLIEERTERPLRYRGIASVSG
jgi:citrate synthase